MEEDFIRKSHDYSVYWCRHRFTWHKESALVVDILSKKAIVVYIKEFPCNTSLLNNRCIRNVVIKVLTHLVVDVIPSYRICELLEDCFRHVRSASGLAIAVDFNTNPIICFLDNIACRERIPVASSTYFRGQANPDVIWLSHETIVP